MALTNFKYRGFSSTGRTGQSGSRTKDNKFSASVSDFIGKSEAMIELLLRSSMQDLVEDASKPTAKGGRMRVDTGFLRNSGIFEEGKLPTGANVKPKDFSDPEGLDLKGVSLLINNAKVGEKWYYGWTANYAIFRENKDGFMRVAAQGWQDIVNKNAKAIEQAFK